MSEFKKQVISSSKWAMLNQTVTQLIRIGTSIYLMRLLDPENFGVFMKVLAVIGISETLIGFRLGGGIVQASSLNKRQVSTVFWITMTGAIILASAFYFSAGLLADFYNDSRITSITKLGSITVIFLGIGYVPMSLLSKELAFKKIFLANMISMAISSITGIWMAHHGFEYWSLVWQWVLYNSITSLFYFVAASKFFKLDKVEKNIQEIWSFSKRILYDDLLNYGVKNIDNVLVGKYLGSADLGYYSRAYNLMLMPIQNFVNIIRGILFPAFAKIKEEKERIKSIFLSAIQTVAFIMLPFFLFSLIFTHEIVLYILKEKWLPIVDILRIFLVLAIIQSHTALISSVYMALGRSDIMLKFGYISRPLVLVLILVSIQFGLMPLVITVTLANSLVSITFLFIGLSLIQAKPAEFIRSLLPIVAVNTIIYGGLFIYNTYFNSSLLPPIQLALLFGGSLLLYILYFERERPAFYLELKSHLPGLKHLP